MARVAVFPGSFDPITKGHEDIVNRALPLFDEIIVAVGVNATKKYTFSLEQRVQWIKETFAKSPQIRVETYEGLTVNFCTKQRATHIIRGLRSSADFQFEKGIAQMNRELADNIDTLFLVTTPELAAISSSIVRDIYRNGGDVRKFVPNAIDIHGDS